MKIPELFQKLKERFKKNRSETPKIPSVINSPIGKNLRGRINSMNRRQRLMLILLMCSFVFLMVLFLFPNPKPKTVKNADQAKPKVETVQVVRAGVDIPRLTVITDLMVEMVEVPKDIVPEGALTDKATLLNCPASVSIQKGDILTNKKVYTDKRMAGFPGRIPDNCRAISVAITDVTGIAGFAKPGDYVDVMVVKSSRTNGAREGEILLQNVLLLGVNKNAKVEQPGGASKKNDKKDGKSDGKDDGKTDDKNADDKKSGGKKDVGAEADSAVQAETKAMANATLALTPEDALKLAVSAQNSTVYLALRPIKPTEATTTTTHYEIAGEERQSTRAADSYVPPQSRQESVVAQVPQNQMTLPNQPVDAQVPVEDTRPKIEVIRGTESTIVRGE